MTKQRIITVKRFFSRIVEPFDINKVHRILATNRKYYQYIYPRSIIYFDAIIIDKTGKLIWYGDLDITRDLADLIKLSKKLKTILYIASPNTQLTVSPTTVKFESPEKVYQYKNKYYYKKGQRKDFNDY